MHTTELACPADATAIDDWENLNGECDGTARPFRYFIGSSWVIPVTGDPWLNRGDYELTVQIRGRQFANGSIERWVHTDLNEDKFPDLPVEAARQLAQSIAAAVAEIEAVR